MPFILLSHWSFFEVDANQCWCEYLLRSVGVEDVEAPHGPDVGEAVEAVADGEDVDESADHRVQEDRGAVVEEVTVIQRVRRI